MRAGARARLSLVPALQVIRGPGRCHQLGTTTEPRGTPHPALRFSKVMSAAGISRPSPLIQASLHRTQANRPPQMPALSSARPESGRSQLFLNPSVFKGTDGLGVWER